MKLPDKHPLKEQRPAKADEGPVRPAMLLEDRRRSQRVMLRMAVVLHVPGHAQAINGMTVAVSELGAMLVVPEPLSIGTKLVVENPNSKQRISASVTRAPQAIHDGSLVPVEFAECAPAFWNIFFPPAGS